MPETQGIPELKQILGALIFGANRPLSIKEMRTCIMEVAEIDPEVAVFADVQSKHLVDALEELQRDLKCVHAGFTVQEVAGGFRLQSDVACGRWLRHLLKTKPQRLSQPALETMAIIAYRQPISKADIESIRGVCVAHIIKGLMEMQLVRICGRSELPGRPFLYGTTHLFLEHFGLKDLKELDRMAPRVLSRKATVPAAAVESLYDGDDAEAAPAVEEDPRQTVMAFETAPGNQGDDVVEPLENEQWIEAERQEGGAADD